MPVLKNTGVEFPHGGCRKVKNVRGSKSPWSPEQVPKEQLPRTVTSANRSIASDKC
jgi:hypothetical protein